MKSKFHPRVFAAPALALFASLAVANATSVRSPETVQTYAYSSILWHQLRWLPGPKALVASITFSTLNYASRVEPRHDERFDFSLPGVKFDSNSGIFFVSDAQGQHIPVAALRPKLIGQSIELLPGAQMNVFMRSGEVHVVLLAQKTPIPGERWAEK